MVRLKAWDAVIAAFAFDSLYFVVYPHETCVRTMNVAAILVSSHQFESSVERLLFCAWVLAANVTKVRHFTCTAEFL